MTIINPLSLVTEGPVGYVISCYQFTFATTTILMEMPEEWMEKVPGLPEYEDLLEDQCKFLLRVLGRGLFLIFQGSLWLGFATLSKVFDLAVGAYLVFIGILFVMMHFEVLPKA